VGGVYIVTKNRFDQYEVYSNNCSLGCSALDGKSSEIKGRFLVGLCSNPVKAVSFLHSLDRGSSAPKGLENRGPRPRGGPRPSKGRENSKFARVEHISKQNGAPVERCDSIRRPRPSVSLHSLDLGSSKGQEIQSSR
jgi:hypothetical protein